MADDAGAADADGGAVHRHGDGGDARDAGHGGGRGDEHGELADRQHGLGDRGRVPGVYLAGDRCGGACARETRGGTSCDGDGAGRRFLYGSDDGTERACAGLDAGG